MLPSPEARDHCSRDLLLHKRRRNASASVLSQVRGEGPGACSPGEV